MRKETHLIIGSITGFITADLLMLFGAPIPYPDLGTRIFLSTIAMLGASLPDTFEVARDYNHRKFFHSKTLLVLLFFTMYAFMESVFVVAFCAGYTSHLIIDSTTRKSLPLF